MAWIYVGLAVVGPVLAACTVWTLAVLSRVIAPPAAPSVTIQVTGARWWWEVRYLDDESGARLHDGQRDPLRSACRSG